MKSSTNDLKLIFQFTFRVFLVLLFFLLYFFHHMAAAITMHLGLLLVHAQVFGDKVFIQLVFGNNQHFAERLTQHSYQ